MPFSVESGITPDIIINPCALPSRMTIAHLVECIASKTGVVLGKFVNGEPFRDMSVEHDLWASRANSWRPACSWAPRSTRGCAT